MKEQRTAAYASSAIIALALLIGTLLVLSGEYPSIEKPDNPPPPWQARTLEDIYAPFDTLATDIDEYIWPTDISRTLTSAFGEFRSTHFHAGIDISTGGVIGAPVFAAQSGYIEQVGVSPFGYGKYIVMRHEDGFSTLYAHLDSFDDAVGERVHEYQLEHRRYSVTLTFAPGEYTYDRGERIARSGSTGSGPPHIHFEIRDPNNNPVNPKFSRNISIRDRMPPIFNRLAGIPVGADAFVNGRITPVTLPAVAVRPGEYVIRNTVRVSGTVGLAADMHDRNNDTWYRHGVYAAELFIGDSLIYSLQYDRLPIEHQHQIRLHYDHFLLSSGRGRFQKLFIEEGNLLPFYDRREFGSGKLDASAFEPGRHPFRVVAYDFSGNRSVLTGTIEFESSPVLSAPPSSPRITGRYAAPFEDSDLHLRTVLFRNNLILEITHPGPIGDGSAAVIRRGNTTYTVPLLPAGSRTYQGRLALNATAESDVQIYYVFNDTVRTERLHIYSIRPDAAGEILLDEGNLKIEYDHGSVYYPLFFTFERGTDDASVVYSINTTSSVLDTGIRVTARVGDDVERFDRTVLYTRENARWNTIAAVRDSTERTLSGMVRRIFSDLKVVEDTTPPSIYNVLVDGNRNMRLRFRVSDNESGIDHSSLVIRKNDDFLIGRYDPDLAMVIYRARRPVSPGSYALAISVRDRAGNSAHYERSVTIR